MAFVPVAGVARVSLVGRMHGSVVVNVLHVEQPAGGGLAGLEAIAEAARDAWVSNVLPEVSGDYALEAVNAIDLDSATGPSFTLPVTSANGAQGTGGLPANVAFCVTWLTGQRGRSGRGRIYIAGVPAGNVEDSRISLAARTQIVAALNGVLDDLATAGFTLVLVSRQREKVTLAVPVVVPITGARSADDVMDSQRRRLPGRGR